VSSLVGTSAAADFFADDSCAVDHGFELGESDVTREMEAAAVGEDEEAFGRKILEGFADAVGDHFGGFDGLRFYVNDADADFESRFEFTEEVEVFAATAGKFEGELVDSGIEDAREEIPVAAFPGRLTVAIAIANVQG
jgi:hypothetical protein